MKKEAPVSANQLKSEILKHAGEVHGHKTLSCHRAHVLAEEFQITLHEIGRLCNEEDVKIVHCQLGCFGDPTHE